MDTYLASQGRQAHHDDDDEDYDDDEANDEYDWGDDDTRYGNAQHFGEEDYYTDDEEGDIERGEPAAPRGKTWGQRVAHVAATGDVFDEVGDDEAFDWGFWLASLFKGTSTGRRLKRLILNFFMWQLACGFPLLVLAVMEELLYGYVGNWFTVSKYGSRYVVHPPGKRRPPSQLTSPLCSTLAASTV